MRPIWLAIATAALLLRVGLVRAQSALDPGAVIDAHQWNAMDCQDECIAGLKPRHWLALVPGANGWTLAPAQLSFTDAETRGVASSVGGAEFYLSHAALIAGHAPTPNVRFKGQRRSFDQHAQPLRLEFHGHHYEIVVDGGEVALREGARKSVFGNVAVDPNGYAETSLLWAGDLDGDGQLDLIIYAGSDKSGSICLLLSSANHKPGELLASVGCQDFSG